MRIICERLPAAELGRVSRVHVDVGEFSGVVPEALAFGFEMAVAGSAMPDARLETVAVPVGLHCRACSARFSVPAPPFVCPQCGAAGAEVMDGTDVVVRSVELKEEVP